MYKMIIKWKKKFNLLIYYLNLYQCIDFYELLSLYQFLSEAMRVENNF